MLNIRTLISLGAALCVGTAMVGVGVARDRDDREVRVREDRQTREVRETSESRDRVRDSERRTEERVRDSREAKTDDGIREDTQTREESDDQEVRTRDDRDNEVREVDLGKVSGSDYDARDELDLEESSSGSGSGKDFDDDATDNSGSSSNSGSGSDDDLDDDDDDSDSSGHGSGSDDDDDYGTASQEFRDLAAKEKPEFDPQGYPARRGEVLALDLTPSQLDRVQARGYRVIAQNELPSILGRLYRIRAPEGTTATQALRDLRTADPNGLYEYDHFFAGQSGGTLTALATTSASLAGRPRTLSMAMIDTAVAAHPVLRDTHVQLRDFTGIASQGGKLPTAHGTAVASILRDQGAARLSAANVFRSDKTPYAAADALVRAIDWISGTGVPVINISIAGPRNIVLERAIARSLAQGNVLVASAGNGGPTAAPPFPAAIPGVIAVTAVDGQGRIYAFANRGNYVAIAAPGVKVSVAAPNGERKAASGTSFAAPFVTAHLSACLTKPDRSRADACIKKMLAAARDLGTPGRDPVYGAGLLRQ